MSVPFTPHTVLIDGVSIACYIEPEDAAALFQDTGIELKNPFRLFAGEEYEDTFTVNKKMTVIYNKRNRTFRVAQPPEVYAAGLPNDHLECLLELTEFD